MSYHITSLEDQNWQTVKRAILDPETSQLPEEQTAMICRIISLARLIDRHPQGKTAISLHMNKYPDISRRTATRDLQCARDLNVTQQSFNYDFWHNWLVNDIIDQIQAAKARGDLRNWSAGHANLIRAIGEKIPEEKDPKLVEKHTFLIQLNQHSKTINIDMKDIDSYSPAELKQISDGIYTEITEEDTAEIFKT